jgi:glycosyltransferase involved in cell wall biosynthesis
MPKPRWIASIEGLLRWIRGGKGVGISARKLAWAGARALLKVPIAIWAIANCDAFVFGFRSHFFGHYELPILRWLGKRSLFIFHGSDARLPYLSGRFVPEEGPIDAGVLIRRTRRLRLALAKIDKWSDGVVNHPPTAHLHTRPYIPWLWMGIPYTVMALGPEVVDQTHEGPLRVVHAPSSPGPKGTASIRQAIDETRSGGVEVEFIELVGRPNAEVLAELGRCDFVIDELFSDTPLAGLGTEAAAAGKPVIVGGYDLDVLRANTPPNRFPPSLLCRPEGLVGAIEALASDAQLRRELGASAREFVEQHWSPVVVAQRVVSILTQRVADDVLESPGAIGYVHGWGLREDRAIEAIRAVVERAGVEGLQLANAETRNGLLELAGLDMSGKSVSGSA